MGKYQGDYAEVLK